MRPDHLRRRLLACLLVLLSAPALAIMAGAEPDSPAARVDPNTVDSPWAGVVAVRVEGKVYSGVIVSPQHVLTAAHVAGAAANAPQKAEIVLNFGVDASHVLAVDQVQLFPGYAFPYDDLALLRLSAPLPEGVPVYPVNDLTLTPGSAELVLVGYGGSGFGNVGPGPGSHASIKRLGWNVLDAITERVDNSGRNSRFYLYDFDGPAGDGQMGGPTLGNARESMVGGGDSGAPAFIISNHGYRAVAGINTFASQLNSDRPLNHGFGQGGGGMLLAEPRFLNWLDEASGGAVLRVSSLPPPKSTLPWWLGGSAAVGSLAAYAGWRWFNSEASAAD